MRSLACAAVAVAVLLAAGACTRDETVDTRSATAGLPTTRQLLEAHEWVLVPDGSGPAAAAGRQATISFSGDAVHGTGPCNTFAGDLSVDRYLGDGIGIERIVPTDRTCDDPTMQRERDFLQALAAVERAHVTAEHSKRLELRNGDVHLAFRAYDADEVLPGDWQVVDVARGGVLEPAVSGSIASLHFDDDHVVVETGCATVRATFRFGGRRLTFGEPGAVPPCAGPPAVADQQTALVDALAAAAAADVAPDSLTILDEGGRPLLVAARPLAPT